MNKNIFDERQQLNQYKYGFLSFFILLFSLIVYTGVKFFFPSSTASDVNEMAFLLFIPLGYFSVATILTSSYCSFSSNKKLNNMILLDTILTFIFLIVFLFYKNAFADIATYKLSSSYIATLLLSIDLLMINIAYVIRFRIDKNNT